MPEVQRIGDPTEPAEGRGCEHDPARRSGTPAGGDDRRGAKGRQESGKARVLRHRPDENEAGAEEADSQPADQGGDCTGHAAEQGDRESQQASGGELPRSCRQQVIGPRAVRGGHHHGQQERARENDGDEERHDEAGAPGPGGEQEQDRPEQIELLFDPERPVVEHRRRGARSEVVGRFQGEADVRDRQAGGQGVVGDARQVERREEQLSREQRAREHDDSRRKDPSGSASVEGAKSDLPGAPTLVHEQPGDQEAGQDEEDVDTDKTGFGAGQTRVAQQDKKDRDPAEPLEVRAETGFG